MKQYILALVLAVVSASVAFAVNPIKEGNMISGHVIVKGTEENIPYGEQGLYCRHTFPDGRGEFYDR